LSVWRTIVRPQGGFAKPYEAIYCNFIQFRQQPFDALQTALSWATIAFASTGLLVKYMVFTPDITDLGLCE